MRRIWAFLGRHPLRTHIASIFILLIMGVGGVSGWFHYHQNTRVILSVSSRVFEQLSREILLDFQGTYGPVVTTVNLLSLEDRIGEAHSLDERLTLLLTFREALATQPHVSALQVGYDNGDFFIVRPLNSPYMREKFEAPDRAMLVVDNIGGNERGERVQTRLYFDTGLNRLAEHSMGVTTYDPRVRPWYTEAAGKTREVATKPYLYYFIGKVGITVSRQSPDGRAVVASDITLEHLSETLARQHISPSAETVLFDEKRHAIAYRDPDRLVLESDTADTRLTPVDGVGSPVLSHLGAALKPEESELFFMFDNREWRGAIRRIDVTDDIVFFVAIAAPKEELVADAILIRRQSIWVTAMILLGALPLAWLLASRISRPLRKLTEETDRIRHFDFAGPVTTNSLILEISKLAEATGAMKSTICKFLDLISSVAAERNFDNLLQQITEQAMRLSQADAVVLYLLNEDASVLEPACVRAEAAAFDKDLSSLSPVRLEDGGGQGPLAESVRTGRTVTFSTLRASGTEAGKVAGPLASLLDTETAYLVAIPLRDRGGQVAATLGLAFDMSPPRNDLAVEQERIAFIEAFSGFAVVSLESQKLLKMQKALLNAFIKLMAGAIDAKSPYTGGHCQRVPVLTQMIAQAACASDTLPFRDFHLDDEGWEALHIASWLHDCGKVTTPEYVVDKATKLETIYNRLHEVRTRFEVLKRDATIFYWERLVHGGDEAELRAELEEEHRRLDDDFAFVARCNEGRESISPEHIDRLRRIGARTWMRTLDDCIGLSIQESERKACGEAHPAPVAEHLLRDAPEHRIISTEKERIAIDNPWGFQLDTPELAYNRGELYNLSADRGTLTWEERCKINDHIVQTIMMLSRLPWPKHLRSVPDIAGGHHEKLDGTGYPRRLCKDQLPLEARIMAIADIFEALTAPDRPYKKPKSLSEALDIMRAMAERNHIDPEVLRLFLQSGACDEYARRYLDPDQIDMKAEHYFAKRT